MLDLSPEIITVLFAVGILTAVLTGYPIFAALGVVGLALGFVTLGPATFKILYSRLYQLLQTYALIAVPLFMFMGDVLQRSNITAGLFDALYVWFGRVRGGLAISTILFGTLLAACLGIIAASVTMMTVIALVPMIQRGYDKALASGAICAGGCLGILIPPSVMLVLYGPMASLSVGKLFMAAIFPGLLLSALYCVYILLRAMIQPSVAPAAPEMTQDIRFSTKLAMLFKGLLPPLALVMAVLGSIFFGVAAPTEAAGVGAGGALLLTVVYRKFNFTMLRDSALETVRMIGFVLPIAASSFAIVGVFIRLGCGEVVKTAILSAPFGHWGALSMIMLLIFILGMFIDWMGIVFVIVPILSPIIPELGFDPLWFAMMVCVNLQMGFMTPPFAQAIFICLGSAPKEAALTMSDVIRGVIPFVALIAVALGLMVFFQDIVLWLPGKMVGGG